MPEHRPHIRVLETSDVTAENLERLLNEMLADGWRFDGIHFVMRENSRRPAMAFLIFYPSAGPEQETTAAPRTPRRRKS
jgi:hypothetical protein